jgi:hypothetical protein
MSAISQLPTDDLMPGIGAMTEFDPVVLVDHYRQIIAAHDAETTAFGRREFQEIAQRMRLRWAEWQGEDSLHEMAFGEPE